MEFIHSIHTVNKERKRTKKKERRLLLDLSLTYTKNGLDKPEYLTLQLQFPRIAGREMRCRELIQPLA